jgi:hypothetical protein
METVHFLRQADDTTTEFLDGDLRGGRTGVRGGGEVYEGQ